MLIQDRHAIVVKLGLFRIHALAPSVATPITTLIATSTATRIIVAATRPNHGVDIKKLKRLAQTVTAVVLVNLVAGNLERQGVQLAHDVLFETLCPFLHRTRPLSVIQPHRAAEQRMARDQSLHVRQERSHQLTVSVLDGGCVDGRPRARPGSMRLLRFKCADKGADAAHEACGLGTFHLLEKGSEGHGLRRLCTLLGRIGVRLRVASIFSRGSLPGRRRRGHIFKLSAIFRRVPRVWHDVASCAVRVGHLAARKRRQPCGYSATLIGDRRVHDAPLPRTPATSPKRSNT